MGLTDRVPGVLEFDFVSISRPSSDTPPLTPVQFGRYVRRLQLSSVSAIFRLVRHVSVQSLEFSARLYAVASIEQTALP